MRLNKNEFLKIFNWPRASFMFRKITLCALNKLMKCQVTFSPDSASEETEVI